MIIQRKCGNVTIFEGPDGSGKTTTAKAYADRVGAIYWHFGPMLNCPDIARFYVEAMTPAFLGIADVVMDRSWLSEYPYAVAYSKPLRTKDEEIRMLERAAMRCGTVVIRCRPSIDVCLSHWNARKADEYLKEERQLRMVYNLYDEQRNDLPEVLFDYTKDSFFEVVNRVRTTPHAFNWLPSAGNWHGRVLLVGDTFADHKETDALYQLPFVSFSPKGCSRWLTRQLMVAGIQERELLWVNAQDFGSECFRFYRDVWPDVYVVALGDAASGVLTRAGVSHEVAPHPQYWKRFHHGEEYPLIPKLREILG